MNTKTLGEKAAWAYVEREKPAFELVSINPTYCLGPHGLQVVNDFNRCVSNSDGAPRSCLADLTA